MPLLDALAAAHATLPLATHRVGARAGDAAPAVGLAGGDTRERRDDQAIISPSGQAALAADEPDRAATPGGNSQASGDATGQTPDATAADQAATPEEREAAEDPSRQRGSDGKPLTESEVQQVRDLSARDREVRAHEQAHVAVAGSYARGGPSYDFQRGPDGRQYAVGGEVPIDTGEEDHPRDTIRKMQTVRRAALAPAEPSQADRAIAADASAKERNAQVELVNLEIRAREAQKAYRDGDEPTPEQVAAVRESGESVTATEAIPTLEPGLTA